MTGMHHLTHPETETITGHWRHEQCQYPCRRQWPNPAGAAPAVQRQGRTHSVAPDDHQARWRYSHLPRRRGSCEHVQLGVGGAVVNTQPYSATLGGLLRVRIAATVIRRPGKLGELPGCLDAARRTAGCVRR